MSEERLSRAVERFLADIKGCTIPPKLAREFWRGLAPHMDLPLQSEHTRLKFILRRILCATSPDACADSEAWAMAEELLSPPKTPSEGLLARYRQTATGGRTEAK